VHNPFNTAISFGLLISVVGGAFFYVYSGGPAERPKEPWIGVTTGVELTPERAEALGINQEYGFLIFSIAPASPADKAGLRGSNNVTTIDGEPVPVGGDIIVSMDGRKINGVEEICAVLTQKQVGESIRFVVVRDNNSLEAEVILEEAPPQSRSSC